MSRPTVCLHIGEPKSGTTFVQQVMWANRDALARQGVLLPGLHPQDHFRANQDLRGVPQSPDDPTGSYAGEWDLLVEQALQADRAAVISHELLAAATEEQAARAIASLDGAEVHLVVTLRDFVSLLPAEWQETVKHGNTLTWRRWLNRVRATQGSTKRARGRWFWRVHDTADLLRRWTPGIPPERVHLVTLPPAGSPPDLLWQRFAAVLGIDPACAELAEARPNASLGLAEVEMLRRLNTALSGAVSEYFYAVFVKERLAHGYLAQRPVTARPILPRRHREWAETYAATRVAALREQGYDVVGDLADLLPRRSSAPAGRRPAAAKDAEVADAAVGALAELLRQEYASPGLAARPRPASGGGFAGPRWVKRAVRDLSSRHPAIKRLRVVAWRISERARARRA